MTTSAGYIVLQALPGALLLAGYLALRLSGIYTPPRNGGKIIYVYRSPWQVWRQGSLILLLILSVGLGTALHVGCQNLARTDVVDYDGITHTTHYVVPTAESWSFYLEALFTLLLVAVNLEEARLSNYDNIKRIQRSKELSPRSNKLLAQIEKFAVVNPLSIPFILFGVVAFIINVWGMTYSINNSAVIDDIGLSVRWKRHTALYCLLIAARTIIGFVQLSTAILHGISNVPREDTTGMIRDAYPSVAHSRDGDTDQLKRGYYAMENPGIDNADYTTQTLAPCDVGLQDEGLHVLFPGTRKEESPELTSGLFKLATFLWLRPILKLGGKYNLTNSTLYRLRPEFRTAATYTAFRRSWMDMLEYYSAKGKTDGKAAMNWTIAIFVSPQIIFGATFKFLYDSLLLMDVLLLNLIISYLTDAYNGEASVSKGLIFPLLMCVNVFTQTALSHQYFHKQMAIGMRIRSAVGAMVYEKTSRIDSTKMTDTQASDFTSGRLVNLISTDAQKLGDFMVYINIIWSSPFQIVIMTTMLFLQLGWAAVGGLVILIASLPLTAYGRRRIATIQKEVMVQKDLRLRATTELVNGIKAVKVYHWEKPSIDRIEEHRTEELRQLKRSQWANLFIRLQVHLVPVLVSVLSFGIYILRGNTLDAATAFTSLALFNNLTAPLSVLPSLISSLADAQVTTHRLQNFFLLPEISPRRECPASEAPVVNSSGQIFPVTSLNGRGSEPIPVDSMDVSGYEFPMVLDGCSEMSSVHRLCSSESSSEYSAKYETIQPIVRCNKRLLIDATNITVSFQSSQVSETSPQNPSAVASDDEATDSEEQMSQKDRFTLMTDATVRVLDGSVTAIVGKTGVGKSTLIQSLLNDVDTPGSRIRLYGNVSLCTQTAWIRSGTVRDNILFGLPYNHSWYKTVISACALIPDFSIMVDSDLTEIGERGVNLSGGQKQRIALARAVYRDADIYLLDDILSAVDTHVARHIFDEVILKLLKWRGKAVVLATHRFESLHEADSIIHVRYGKTPKTFSSITEAMADVEFVALAAEEGDSDSGIDASVDQSNSNGGKVKTTQQDVERQLQRTDSANSHSIDYSDVDLENLIRRNYKVANEVEEMTLLDKEDSCYRKIGRGCRSADASAVKTNDNVVVVTTNDEGEEEGEDKPHQIIQKEDVESGKVSGAVYLDYFRACGGITRCLLIFILMCSFQALNVAGGFWLSKWSSNPDMSVGNGYGGYIGFRLGSIAIMSIPLVLLIYAAQRCARTLHTELIDAIVHAKMQFYEATTVGRIMNRFSKDVFMTDDPVTTILYQFALNVVAVLAALVTIIIVVPFLLILIVPVMAVYLLTEHIYVNVARQIKRIDSVTRSPCFTHFSESIDGNKIIRACNTQQYFSSLHSHYFDENISVSYVFCESNRWLAVRLESLGAVMTVGVALALVCLGKSIPAGKGGLALSYSISITQALTWVVRMSGERESAIISVERITAYSRRGKNGPAQIADKDTVETDLCPRESYNDSPRFSEQDMLANINQTGGSITFKNIELRYRPHLPPAINDVSFYVNPGERVGIVGRTGAGKSSILVTLLRLVEHQKGAMYLHAPDTLSPNATSRTVDPSLDIDTWSVGRVRTHMCIIPQDPVLFSGTLRFNIDPHNISDDATLFEICRTAALDDFVTSVFDLDRQIHEGGRNISVGQRQLVCLARVLLQVKTNNTKILLLDEATSSVDPHTDACVQRVIRSFASEYNITVMTIAHRLKSVFDYDRIIVMDAGKIAEEGHPQALLADETSLFYQMSQA